MKTKEMFSTSLHIFSVSRYQSRRNPYCRTICHELRMSLEALAYSPKCPGWAKNIIYKAITVATSLGPVAPGQS